MNFRLTGIFFGLVLLLVGGLLVLLLLDGGDTATAPDTLLDRFARAGVKATDIDSVEIVRTQPTEEKLVFVKANDRWELQKPTTAKVDGFAVDGLVRDLFRAAPVRHPDLTTSLGVHGLDKPTVKITLGKGDQFATVNVGLTTVGGDRAVTFVSTAAAPDRPLAVKRADLNGLFRDTARNKDGAAWELARWLPDFRARRPLGADLRSPEADATAVKLSAGGKEVALARSPDGGWVFTSPAAWGAADELGESQAGPSTAPFTGVRPLLAALANITVGPDDYLDKPGDLAQYGLNEGNPDRVRVELAGKAGPDGKAGPPDVLFVGKVVEKDGKPVTPTRVYDKYDTDPAVFTMPFDRLDTLKATVQNPAPLRNRDLLPLSAKDRVDAIDLTVGGQTAKLRKVAAGPGQPARWWLFGGPHGPAEAKSADVDALLAGLSRPRLAREVSATPNDPAFAGNEVQAVAKFWTGSTPGKSEPGKPPAEPAVNGEPLATLTVGRTTSDLTAVRRQIGAATADLGVSVLDVKPQLVRTRASLLDPKLTPVDPTKATKLTITRGAEVTEITRDDKGIWTFAKPDARKGQTADGPRALLLLGTLGNLPVVAVAAETATPDELKKWGLEPPAVTAVAALDGPDKERAVQFGGPVDGGNTVYARVTGSPLVLAVVKPAADELAAPDLRDRTVFRLDPAAVTKLTLRGYKAGDKGPETYKFEKAGEAWKAVAPTPAGFAPDGARLNALLGVLAAPRAEAFVGVGSKPEYGLDPAANAEALEVGIERTGGPPLTLVLGAKASDGLVYAASSAVPGEVFSTRVATPVQQLAGRPANFQAPVPPPTPVTPAPVAPTPAPTPPTAAATPATPKK